MRAGRPQNAKNLQPRIGFAYQMNDLTVLRGGAGLFYDRVGMEDFVIRPGAHPRTIDLICLCRVR